MRYYYGSKFKSNWEEINLENLLSDARSQRMTTPQLASRYQIDQKTVLGYLKKYGIVPKGFKTGCGKKINDMARGYGYVSDMSYACGTIFPKTSLLKNLYG